MKLVNLDTYRPCSYKPIIVKARRVNRVDVTRLVNAGCTICYGRMGRYYGLICYV
jgi:hypothetical protein